MTANNATIEDDVARAALIERARAYCDGWDGKSELGVGPNMMRELIGHLADALALPPQVSVTEAQTPAARWRDEGQADPHGNRYACDRRELCGGQMTDDELANAVYMDPSIVNLTAAKDRIRWLSRQLSSPSASLSVTEAMVEQAAQIITPGAWWIGEPPNSHQQRRVDLAKEKARAVFALSAVPAGGDGAKVRVCRDGRDFVMELAMTMGVVDHLADEGEQVPVSELMPKMLARAQEDRQRWHDAGDFVLIWSEEHRMYWRANGAGYTPRAKDAGVYTREDAVSRTRHCAEEKQIELDPARVTTPPSEPSDGELREILAREAEAQGMRSRCVSARELDIFDRMVTAALAAMRQAARRAEGK